MRGACCVQKKSHWIELFDRPSWTRYLGSARRHHFVVIHIDDAGTFQKERGKEWGREGREGRIWDRGVTRVIPLSGRLRKIHIQGKWTWNQLEFARRDSRLATRSRRVPSLLHRYRRADIIMSLFIRGHFLERIWQKGVSASAKSKFHCNEMKWSSWRFVMTYYWKL